jgi:hypothetical protein
LPSPVGAKDVQVNANFDDQFLSASKRFKELRKIKGHFEGGQWIDSIDKYGGEKHLVMQLIEKDRFL